MRSGSARDATITRSARSTAALRSSGWFMASVPAQRWSMAKGRPGPVFEFLQEGRHDGTVPDEESASRRGAPAPREPQHADQRQGWNRDDKGQDQQAAAEAPLGHQVYPEHESRREDDCQRQDADHQGIQGAPHRRTVEFEGRPQEPEADDGVGSESRVLDHNLELVGEKSGPNRMRTAATAASRRIVASQTANSVERPRRSLLSATMRPLCAPESFCQMSGSSRCGNLGAAECQFVAGRACIVSSQALYCAAENAISRSQSRRIDPAATWLRGLFVTFHNRREDVSTCQV
jgi:hypothetical protein